MDDALYSPMWRVHHLPAMADVVARSQAKAIEVMARHEADLYGLNEDEVQDLIQGKELEVVASRGLDHPAGRAFVLTYWPGGGEEAMSASWDFLDLMELTEEEALHAHKNQGLPERFKRT